MITKGDLILHLSPPVFAKVVLTQFSCGFRVQGLPPRGNTLEDVLTVSTKACLVLSCTTFS